MEFTVLIVDDEEEVCITLSELLNVYNIHSIYSISPFNVINIINSHQIDLIIMDLKMPKLSGIDLLYAIREKGFSIPIIMVTGYPNIEKAVLAMKYGASDFLIKPLDNKKLINTIRSYMISVNHNDEPIPRQLVYKSKIMEQIVTEITYFALTDVPVLITGESGTGKELIAEMIHRMSRRNTEAMIKVNCASLPDTLLESELFGHEAGAFTDAKKAYTGKFELAAKGTLFLDEIGEMSLKTQPKILRALEEGEIQKIGCETVLRIKPRIIAATNRNLQDMIKEAKFREDLYFRLSIVEINLPPLRQRKEDLLVLTEYFIGRFNEKYCKAICGFSDEVRKIILIHSWPGNIRELKNCIERAVIFTKGDCIEQDSLPSQYREYTEKIFSDDITGIVDLISREQIEDALVKTGGNKSKAANLLNITRKTLYNRMNHLGIKY